MKFIILSATIQDTINTWRGTTYTCVYNAGLSSQSENVYKQRILDSKGLNPSKQRQSEIEQPRAKARKIQNRNKVSIFNSDTNQLLKYFSLKTDMISLEPFTSGSNLSDIFTPIPPEETAVVLGMLLPIRWRCPGQICKAKLSGICTSGIYHDAELYVYDHMRY